VIKRTAKRITGAIKKQSFVTGAMTLAGAAILCRLIGIGFRIPLVNIVGNYGMGLYQMVFPLYALLLIISSAGIPVAISKMVARHRGDLRAGRRILLNALVLLGIIGLILSVLFFVFANHIAALQGNYKIGPIYMAIAPAVFFVCLIGAFRGYFQGQQNMIPTAVSQVVEQTVKVGTGLALAILLLPYGMEWAVFGAIMAVTVSEIIGFVTLLIIYIVHKRKNPAPQTRSVANAEPRAPEPHTGKILSLALMWEITKKSIPITLMASIFPLVLVFDSMIVINMLQRGGHSHAVATQLYGICTGTVHTLINMPAVLGIAIGTAVVPMTARLLKSGDTAEMMQKFRLAVKIIFVIALFFAAFYMVFGRQIITLLYDRAFRDNPEQLRIATTLLKIEAGMILLMGLSQVFTSLQQGAGRARYPLIAMSVGGAVKIVFGLIFIRTAMGIYAVSIGNALMFFVAFCLNLWFTRRFFKHAGVRKTKINKKMLGKLLILMILYSSGLIGLMLMLPNGKLWILLGGAIAFGFYALLLLCLRIFVNVKHQSDAAQNSK